jgi:hypothetical protein
VQERSAGKVTTESKPTTKTAKPTAAPAATTAPPKSEPAKEQAKDSALVQWAKGEHARAVALVRNGDCAAAAKVAVNVSNRASSYYTQQMQTDRNLKGCQARIAAEREAEAERSQKARASKKVNADEPYSESIK